MNKLRIFAGVLLGGLMLLGCAQSPAKSSKFLIILQADTDRHEGLARAR